MKLNGIELFYYRSIGGSGVRLQPWRKANILIGQNNAGKSNVIRAVDLALQLTQTGRRGRRPELSLLSSVDSYRRDDSRPFKYTLHFEAAPDDVADQRVVSQTGIATYAFTWEERSTTAEIVDSSFGHLAKYGHDRNGRDEFVRLNEVHRFLNGTTFGAWVDAEKMNESLARAAGKVFDNYFASALPDVAIIPEFRQIQSGDAYSFRGTNLIAELGRFQHPPAGEDSLRERFDALQQFIRQLLLMPDAQLEVTHDNKTLLLANDGMRLPLSSYGTGVHQLVILLTAVLSLNKDTICCIEEPEIHLHPRLQREFIRFLTEQTRPTYLISSHSSTLISAHLGIESQKELDLQLQHLRQSPNGSTSTAVLSDDASLTALEDLGVRASDLLQANCIIWVEGPSDRLYINHWLHLLNPDLIEGLHYSIMFYGGRLLAHLSLGRSKIPEQLIPLLSINQKSAVVMDSDREKSHQHLSATKRRVTNELKKTGGLAWVTHGREIENYLPSPVLEAFVQERFGGSMQPIELGRYERIENLFSAVVASGKKPRIDYASNKVRYSKLMLQYFKLDHLQGNLGLKVKELERFIRRANGQHHV